MPQPINVVHLSMTLSMGGAQRVTSTLLRHLDRTMVRSTLCLARDDIGYEIPDDIPVHVLGYRGPQHLLRTVNRLRRCIDDLRPDVLLSNVSASSLIAGLALRRVGHRPVWIARIAGSPQHHDGLGRTVVAHWVYPQVDRFTVNSYGLRGGLASRHRFTVGKIDCLPNPTDFDLIDQLAGAPPVLRHEADLPLFVAAGRLARQKRYDIMLRALQRVVREAPAVLWLCGEGPERARLEALIKRCSLTRHVRLLGFCKNPFALFRQAQVFLMTSDWEGLPNALIEAQGLGLPAIATQCPYGPDEIIESERTGLLVPTGDVEAVAAAMLRVMREPETRRRMGCEARLRARARFSAETLTRAWERLFIRVCRSSDKRAQECRPEPAIGLDHPHRKPNT